jgi:hypothetical protein
MQWEHQDYVVDRVKWVWNPHLNAQASSISQAHLYSHAPQTEPNQGHTKLLNFRNRAVFSWYENNGLPPVVSIHLYPTVRSTIGSMECPSGSIKNWQMEQRLLDWYHLATSCTTQPSNTPQTCFQLPRPPKWSYRTHLLHQPFHTSMGWKTHKNDISKFVLVSKIIFPWITKLINHPFTSNTKKMSCFFHTKVHHHGHGSRRMDIFCMGHEKKTTHDTCAMKQDHWLGYLR